MPWCGTSKDENTVPPSDKGGLQGGFETQEQTHPGVVRHSSDG